MDDNDSLPSEDEEEKSDKEEETKIPAKEATKKKKKKKNEYVEAMEAEEEVVPEVQEEKGLSNRQYCGSVRRKLSSIGAVS